MLGSPGTESRFQWPRDLRRRSAAAHLLGLWVRIPPGTWMFVLCFLSEDKGKMQVSQEKDTISDEAQSTREQRKSLGEREIYRTNPDLTTCAPPSLLYAGSL